MIVLRELRCGSVSSCLHAGASPLFFHPYLRPFPALLVTVLQPCLTINYRSSWSKLSEVLLPNWLPLLGAALLFPRCLPVYGKFPQLFSSHQHISGDCRGTRLTSGLCHCIDGKHSLLLLFSTAPTSAIVPTLRACSKEGFLAGVPKQAVCLTTSLHFRNSF
ncbi:hypothetical protein BDW72DRAFT_150390 [Aspergillus terricola var. indicus]